MAEQTTDPSVSRVFNFSNMEKDAYAYLDGLLDEQPAKAYKSGIPALDRNMGGIRRGEVCVLGGRTSQGKSLVALQWMYEVARQGSSCLLISEEMGKKQLSERLVSHTCGLNRDEVTPQHYDEVFGAIQAFWQERSRCHTVHGVATVSRAVEAIEHAVKYFGVEFVVVDYMQLLNAPGNTRYEQVSAVSRSIKSAAVANDIAVVSLAQVGRAVETRDNIPRLSDLKESGQIEQDADQVLIIQWPLKSDPKYPDPHEYRVFCLKNRNGPMREPVLKLEIDPRWQKIVEPEPAYEPAFRDWNNREQQ